MPGTSDKLVTLPGDKTPHLLGADEQTECGLPIPIGSGATWTYQDRGDVTGKVCGACTKAVKKADAAPDDVLLPTEVVDDTVEDPKAKAKSGGAKKAS